MRTIKSLSWKAAAQGVESLVAEATAARTSWVDRQLAADADSSLQRLMYSGCFTLGAYMCLPPMRARTLAAA